MTSICEKKLSPEVRLIHAEQISLHNFIVLRKKQLTQLKTKEVKQDILNKWESMGFPKLHGKTNSCRVVLSYTGKRSFKLLKKKNDKNNHF